ncbi:glucose-methanol-choline oxidoreductase [Anopheles sinensis]|uniref:Glucose-methanol-choline oxidoreductase n=1 Tax=Anopheles sinensis TaxID=74873 RepID=A0A084WBX1_ANOSI|nr:glucose-methanol-choline oxidoreductase [Anopheles sinensis]
MSFVLRDPSPKKTILEAMRVTWKALLAPVPNGNGSGELNVKANGFARNVGRRRRRTESKEPQGFGGIPKESSRGEVDCYCAARCV